MDQFTEEAKQEMTQGEVLRQMARGILLPGDPERLYIEWMIRNTTDLKGAVTRLGLVVEEGPGFADRLKAAVMPKLVERYEPR
jgi:hypothetical protein